MLIDGNEIEIYIYVCVRKARASEFKEPPHRTSETEWQTTLFGLAPQSQV